MSGARSNVSKAPGVAGRCSRASIAVLNVPAKSKRLLLGPKPGCRAVVSHDGKRSAAGQGVTARDFARDAICDRSFVNERSCPQARTGPAAWERSQLKVSCRHGAMAALRLLN